MIKALPTALLAHLIEESLDAVLIMDADRKIRYVNAAMEKLCGYMAGELLGESLNGLLPEAIAAEHDSYVRRYLESLRPSTVLGHVRELELRHRTGEIIPIELKAVDLGVDNGMRFFGAFLIDLRMGRAMEAKHAVLLKQLEQQALTDALTGLPNRRAFELEAARVMANAKREAWPVTIGVADIDWFKRANDQHGHPAGDAVMRFVAQTIQSRVRAGDLCGRIGGDEFGLLFPHATPEQVADIAERIRVGLAAAAISAAPNLSINVTISIGLATLDVNGSLDAAIAAADAALYQAKLTGRNRVVIAQST
jgi:diguanylate cyclase (GGDEF)-like protein/PAS domain S-box-containing protein